MDQERITALVTLLNQRHGKPDEYGFVVAPESDAQLEEHKKALSRTDRMFNYQPISGEKLGIVSVTREKPGKENMTGTPGYTASRLEQMEYESLSAPEVSHLLAEYIEYTRSWPNRGG